MLPSRKTLIAGAFAGMALTATLAGTALAGPGQGGENEAPPGCTKVEFTDGTTTYEVPAGVTVTIKAGNVVYGPFVGPTTVTAADIGNKDISYIITCLAPSPTLTS